MDDGIGRGRRRRSEIKRTGVMFGTVVFDVKVVGVKNGRNALI